MPADDLDDLDDLAALLALDALPVDEQADAELRFGTVPAELAEAVTALAGATETEPPSGLRAATLDRALARRPAGRPGDGAAPCSPHDAYLFTVAEFADLLAGLRPEEWRRPAHAEHGSVRGVVAHLTGVERLCLAWLDPTAAPPVDPDLDHVAATRPAVDELARLEVDALARAWHETALAVADAAASGDPQRPVSFHDVVTVPTGLLVMRTFELWAHGMDIALATDRPLPALDAARMALLSATLMQVLPQAMAYRGGPAPQGTARFVLTGSAGGCFTVPLDAAAGAGAPGVTIVADAVELCRVAARRLRAADLPVTIEGDRALGLAVLARIDSLARD
jgi:uncharacterized protein (TIGR03083 family)